MIMMFNLILMANYYHYDYQGRTSNDLSDDYVEEELPRGGNGRSRARMLKKAEAHRFAILIANQGFIVFVIRIVTMMKMITMIVFF